MMVSEFVTVLVFFSLYLCGDKLKILENEFSTDVTNASHKYGCTVFVQTNHTFVKNNQKLSYIRFNILLHVE